MIITRTPYRVSFCGGGTDLPGYYLKNGGCVVSTTIDKYLYISVADSFDRSTSWLKYSVVESVSGNDEIKHPIFREAMRRYGISGVEINSTGDVPSGTGLGSSSTFTVGLINALRTKCGMETSRETLAKEACELEIDLLNEPIGKQDQYAAAYGGLNFIEFGKDGSVRVEPIPLPDEKRRELDDNLVMFYIGGTRSASKILRKYRDDTAATVGVKRDLAKLAMGLRDDLGAQRIDTVGEVLDKGWKLKRRISSEISNGRVDELYDIATENGAVGGKLLGAGSSGFMLFYCEKGEQGRLRRALNGCREMEFNFERTGSAVIYDDTMRSMSTSLSVSLIAPMESNLYLQPLPFALDMS